MRDDVIRDRAVYVIHLEDPAGSGLTACTGTPFEPHVSRIGDTPLVACTGCTFVLPRLHEVRKRAAEAIGRALEGNG